MSAMPERYALMDCATRAGFARDAGHVGRAHHWAGCADVMRRMLARVLDMEVAS